MYLNVRKPPLHFKFIFNPFSFPRPPLHNALNLAFSPTTCFPTPQKLSQCQQHPSRLHQPHGELIFLSRIDKSFRKSYTRHCAAFERRREEPDCVVEKKIWISWIMLKLLLTSKLSPNPPLPMPSPGTRTLSMSSRGRGAGSAVPTPTGSRCSSPVPRQKRSLEIPPT